jgi:hypothetical protein
MVATQKVSVTLEASSIERARRAAGPRGLSSYVDAAVQEKLARDERRIALLEFIEQLNDVDPPTPEERARAAKRAARLLERFER